MRRRKWCGPAVLTEGRPRNVTTPQLCGRSTVLAALTPDSSCSPWDIEPAFLHTIHPLWRLKGLVSTRLSPVVYYDPSVCERLSVSTESDMTGHVFLVSISWSASSSAKGFVFEVDPDRSNTQPLVQKPGAPKCSHLELLYTVDKSWWGITTGDLIWASCGLLLILSSGTETPVTRISDEIFLNLVSGISCFLILLDPPPQDNPQGLVVPGLHFESHWFKFSCQSSWSRVKFIKTLPVFCSPSEKELFNHAQKTEREALARVKFKLSQPCLSEKKVSSFCSSSIRPCKY